MEDLKAQLIAADGLQEQLDATKVQLTAARSQQQQLQQELEQTRGKVSELEFKLHGESGLELHVSMDALLDALLSDGLGCLPAAHMMVLVTCANGCRYSNKVFAGWDYLGLHVALVEPPPPSACMAMLLNGHDGWLLWLMRRPQPRSQSTAQPG